MKTWDESIFEQFKDEETPYLLLDLTRLEERMRFFKNVSYIDYIYYAVKANPSDEVLKVLIKEGCCFDCASVNEIKKVLRLGCDVKKIHYGNPMKKEKDIKFAYETGVIRYVCDSQESLEKLQRNAPGSEMFFRLAFECEGADWALSEKFGNEKDVLIDLIIQSKKRGMKPVGLSFHVGSQQKNPGAWDAVLTECKEIFDAVAKEGIELTVLNMGGGFPSVLLKGANIELEKYVSEIEQYINKHFDRSKLKIVIEPGRGMTADIGVIVADVVNVRDFRGEKWVYLDIGLFTGLAETIGEAIKYPIVFGRESDDLVEVILAGPTCDSMDVLYKNYKYKFPRDVHTGDRVYLYATGAYTRSYCAIEFNGFSPLKEFSVRS